MCGPLSPAAACGLAPSPGSPHSVALGEHRASGSADQPASPSRDLTASGSWTEQGAELGPPSRQYTILLPGAWQAVGRLSQKVTVGYVLHIIPVPLVPRLLSRALVGQERECWEADWDRAQALSHTIWKKRIQSKEKLSSELHL